MILRDPVHGLISFEGPREDVVRGLLAAREVQRMRNIRQLGLTSLVFPGAEHSRFAHALGTAHVMARLLDRIRAIQEVLAKDMRLDAEAEADALAAALLHDVGHGPFSHLFEEVFPNVRRHEAWTADIIRDPQTDVHRALSSMRPDMPDSVADLLSGAHRLSYLPRAIAGTLDVDRCDYLLRDSHMTGVGYGVYDLDWLLRALTFGYIASRTRHGEWVLAVQGSKGLPPIEGFFLARQFMYQQVYHHKATRAADSLIRAVFLRVAELVTAGHAPDPIPAALRAAVQGEPVSLADYLALDDARFVGCLRAWEHASDALLSELTRNLAVRRLPKTAPLSTGRGAEIRWRQLLDRARDVAQQQGFRPELSVWLDVPSDVPYAEPSDDPAEGLWVVLRGQRVRRLGDVSFLLGELRNKRTVRPRLVFPEAIRSHVAGLMENAGERA